jgi:flagellar basal-body rod modification protein FlgD
MINPTGSMAAASGPPSGGDSTGGGLTALADRDTFLRLLVVQVRHQDPLNPQEPVEFVGQLAQFSQLETLLAMRSSLEAIEAGLAQADAGMEGNAVE